MVGIDLGTTFTAAAVRAADRTEIVPLGNRAATIPTVVFLRPDGTLLVGEAAERRGLAEPDRLARECKRRVGDTEPIILGGAPYSAERLLAALLKQVVAVVAEREEHPRAGLAVCHPAHWAAFKVDLLRHAVGLAGLRDVVLLTEPVAAALYHASQRRLTPGATVAVYDLGGGTFDAAVLQKTDTGFSLLGEPEGIERLGGVDFDEAVFDHVRRALDGRIDELDVRDPAARSAVVRLRQECTAAKEALSFDTETTIQVLLPNVATELCLQRAQLEAMLRPSIDDTVEVLRRALERAGVRPVDLSTILLVGGSSRIPLVADVVSSALARPVSVEPRDAQHAVALGAALAAATAWGETAPDASDGADDSSRPRARRGQRGSRRPRWAARAAALLGGGLRANEAPARRVPGNGSDATAVTTEHSTSDGSTSDGSTTEGRPR